MVTRRPNTTCAICSKDIYRRPSQIVSGDVFCSQACVGASQRKDKLCKICSTSYSGARRTCSRACANKARAGINYTKSNRFNKAYQGSLLKEKLARKYGGVCLRCGHTNFAILQVHHRVERHRGGTDALTNLELLCPNCHATHHQGVALYQPK